MIIGPGGILDKKENILLGNMINIEDTTYFENPRWAETNMVMSLASAATWLRSDTVVISYADIFFGRDVVRDGVHPSRWPLDRAPFPLETSIPGVFAAGK